jgi:hypothetical protein
MSLKTEYVRTYVSAFERTCVECVCVKWAMRLNVKGSSNAFVHQCVCVMGRCGRTHASEFVCNLVSTFECTGYIRTQSAQ